ncbi:hypothetical protein EK21DRAFT_89381 [Setomelanomma holmii]|uniref:Uncharacterized protein n=1 Tax=Setomelanomma holmii TaxID=210430 RepID=A0A9P4H8Y4_9PLEO|nr:hypothetical protein EK21DRAFT_89381 [Setomelanomma holmii]
MACKTVKASRSTRNSAILQVDPGVSRPVRQAACSGRSETCRCAQGSRGQARTKIGKTLAYMAGDLVDNRVERVCNFLHKAVARSQGHCNFVLRYCPRNRVKPLANTSTSNARPLPASPPPMARKLQVTLRRRQGRTGTPSTIPPRLFSPRPSLPPPPSSRSCPPRSPPFFRLPEEIRNIIYGYVLSHLDYCVQFKWIPGKSRKTQKPEAISGDSGACLNQLRYVNWQLYREAAGLELIYNTVLFREHNPGASTRRFFEFAITLFASKAVMAQARLSGGERVTRRAQQPYLDTTKRRCHTGLFNLLR